MNVKERIIETVKEKKDNFNLWDSIKDWVISFAVAAVVYFIILPVFLGSSTPLVVVSSCSEKPFLNIGDIVVVQGVDVANVTAQNVQTELNPEFFSFDGTLKIGDQVFQKNSENDIVVYYANPSGLQIIHRVLVKINDKYLMTMGDNNNVPDQLSMVLMKTGDSSQRVCFGENYGCLSTLINDEMLVGKQVFAIPLIGHVKLFFCDIMPFCDGHANQGTDGEYLLTC